MPVPLDGIVALLAAASGRAVLRRGRHSLRDQRALGGQLLGTLVRHRLLATLAQSAHPVAVILASFVASLERRVGAGVRPQVARAAALRPAVHLTPIAHAADEEDRLAPGASIVPQAVSHALPLRGSDGEKLGERPGLVRHTGHVVRSTGGPGFAPRAFRFPAAPLERSELLRRPRCGRILGERECDGTVKNERISIAVYKRAPSRMVRLYPARPRPAMTRSYASRARAFE